MNRLVVVAVCALALGIVAAPTAAADPGPNPGCWTTYTEVHLSPDPLGVGPVKVPTGIECGY